MPGPFDSFFFQVCGSLALCTFGCFLGRLRFCYQGLINIFA